MVGNMGFFKSNRDSIKFNNFYNLYFIYIMVNNR